MPIQKDVMVDKHTRRPADFYLRKACSVPMLMLMLTNVLSASCAVAEAPRPTIELAASSSVVEPGGSVEFSWRSTGATICKARTSYGWNTELDTEGTVTLGPLADSFLFRIFCQGPGGYSRTRIEITVANPESDTNAVPVAARSTAASSGGLTLRWTAPTENVDGSPLTDLAGFKVYYGSSSRNYDNSTAVLPIGQLGIELTLPAGEYYFAVTAIDEQGNESTYSNEVKRRH